MRVLVCGGRDYRDRDLVFATLYGVRQEHGDLIERVIEGGGTGADEHARAWARLCGLPPLTYHPDWTAHGKAAGPIRNQRMLDEGKPDLVVAFPGGRGTADMVRRAKADGVPVKEVK